MCAKPFIVMYGEPGSGKSTSAAEAAQNCYYVKSSPNVTHYYDTWVETPEGKASGLAKPTGTKLIDTHSIDGRVTFDDNGEPVPVNNTAALEAVVMAYRKLILTAASKNEPPKYRSIVFDEWTTFMQRCFEETCNSEHGLSERGKPDTRAAYLWMGRFQLKLCNALRQVVNFGSSVIVVCHPRDPEEGRLGGPKTPSATMAKQLCADADVVVQRCFERTGDVMDKKRPLRRFWKTEVDDQWLRKVRGVNIQPEEDCSLRELLAKGGWEL